MLKRKRLDPQPLLDLEFVLIQNSVAEELTDRQRQTEELCLDSKQTLCPVSLLYFLCHTLTLDIPTHGTYGAYMCVHCSEWSDKHY